MRIVVLGHIVRGPVGGMVWHYLQYVMGLVRMGHDVWYLEDSGDSPWCCYDPTRHLFDTDPTFGLAFAARTFEAAGVPGRWAYFDAHTARWHGPLANAAFDCCAEADLLLNVSGENRLRRWTGGIPRRALIDTDPVFTQIRHLTDAARRDNASRHTAFFTFAENIGRGATIPDDGLPWQPTRQPIVLEAWPIVPPPVEGRLTTVMQWESYAPVEYEGRRYGLKADSFAPFLGLPAEVGPVFEVAVGGSTAPPLLRKHGWTVSDPLEAIPDAHGYQRFLQQSKGEFSVAKEGYVVSQSGWFSERSAAYLASGRPVVLQDTGFRRYVPSGDGLLPFSSPAEAVRAVTDVLERCAHHSRAARALAEVQFDSTHVLQHLLDRAG